MPERREWHYTVRCDLCDRPAQYKLAAEWSDGVLSELKTYGLACAEHVEALFQSARERHAAYRPRPPEALGPLRVYRWRPGLRDRELEVDEAWQRRIEEALADR